MKSEAKEKNDKKKERKRTEKRRIVERGKIRYKIGKLGVKKEE